eukprot:SAG31_NODE_3646_length_4030_cov_2.435767_1_plen_1076_part_00
MYCTAPGRRRHLLVQLCTQARTRYAGTIRDTRIRLLPRTADGARAGAGPGGYVGRSRAPRTKVHTPPRCSAARRAPQVARARARTGCDARDLIYRTTPFGRSRVVQLKQSRCSGRPPPPSVLGYPAWVAMLLPVVALFLQWVSTSSSPSSSFSCKLFNCTCQGCADYYGVLRGRGFGCTPVPAQTFWRAHQCKANAKSGKCCDGPACKLPGHAPCQLPPGPSPRPPPVPPAPLPPSGPPGTPPKVTWVSPTVEPSSEATGNQIIGGGQPIGNGNLVASVFPIVFSNATLHCINTTASPDGRHPSQRFCPVFSLKRGVSLFVNMATAMSSDTSLVRMGVITVQTEPDMFSGGRPAKFVQELNAADASVTITTDIAAVKVWVDALSNAIFIKCSSTDGKLLQKLEVHVQSVRPPTNNSAGQPDVLASDASANAITISRRNEDTDPAGIATGFNTTLKTEGLASLLDELQPSDRWRHRSSGLSLSGMGDAKPLRPVNKSTLASTEASSSFTVLISAHSNQTESSEEFQRQLSLLHAMHRENTDRYRVHAAWWSAFWKQSHIHVTSSSSTTDMGYLNRAYALTRYVQAIQASDSHWVPIKFNGMQFSTNLGLPNGPDSRGWGANSWWQNTRLPYGNMLASGDVHVHNNILEFFLQMTNFSLARTKLYFNHTGIYYTETKTLFGSYALRDYGYRKPYVNRSITKTPVAIEGNPFIRFDYGGDGGTTEMALMVLDMWAYSRNRTMLQRYLPLVVNTIDFFRQHYPARDKQGKMVVFPTQALETYWCAWEGSHGARTYVEPTPENCPTNDHPTVSSLHVLMEKALWLPDDFVGRHRAEWVQFQSILPPVPLIEEDGVLRVSPYETYPRAQRIGNGETPELYSSHPNRYFSIGRHLFGARDISPSIQCMINSSRQTCRNAMANQGWNQGLMNAALLGLTGQAQQMVLERALTPPSPGYRFPAFAPHFQDSEPSSDHFANMMTAVQWMLLQPADDEAGSSVLFAAWPCSWDVSFKLMAPMATIVEGVLKGGKLQTLTVTPAAHRPLVHVLNCSLSSKTYDASYSYNILPTLSRESRDVKSVWTY